MTNEDRELLESIDQRLKWLLTLRVEEKFEEDATNREKVKMLYRMGFDYSEMADVIGTSSSSVRGTVSSLKSDGEVE